jgi:hypothetical protein
MGGGLGGGLGGGIGGGIGAGIGGGAPSAFGQQQPPQQPQQQPGGVAVPPASNGFGLGVPPVNTGVGAQPLGGGASTAGPPPDTAPVFGMGGMNQQEIDAAWAASAFELGKVPEAPPPPSVCS